VPSLSELSIGALVISYDWETGFDFRISFFSYSPGRYHVVCGGPGGVQR
jgi:hypothetical protein